MDSMYETLILYENYLQAGFELDTAISIAENTNIAIDVSEAEYMYNETCTLIEEAASKENNKGINDLKIAVTKSEKLLEKYKEPASKVNPVGLTYKKWIEYLTPAELKKGYDNAFKYLDSFDPEKVSVEECRKYILKSAFQLQSAQICKKLFPGSSAFGGTYSALVKKKKYDKNINKNDIKDAIKFIESADSEINNIQSELIAASQRFVALNTKALPTPLQMIGSEKTIRKRAMKHKAKLVSLLNTYYMHGLLAIAKGNLKQSHALIVKAAKYNPRNVKESYVIMDYIDALYEMMNILEE